MPRNRYKNKNKTTPIPATESHSPAIQASPTTQSVITKIASGGEEYLMRNLERILLDSYSLADEPEFLDIHMNPERVGHVTQHWLKKYERRLKSAEKKGGEEFQLLNDEVRIKIIDELAQPAFRNLVSERLDLMRNRLFGSNNAKKIELALTLGPVLQMKDLPWGICGLIIAIYERSLQQTLQDAQDGADLVESVLMTLKEEGQEVTDPREILNSPAKLELASKKLFKKNPGLEDSLRKKTDAILDSFEDDVFHGKIPLKLFTKEEILLPFMRLEEEFGKPISEIEPNKDFSNHVLQIIIETINHIMTPERFQRLRRDVKNTAKNWRLRNPRWAMPLEIELGWLEEDGDKAEQNHFIKLAFLGQLKQMMCEQKPGAKGKKR